MTFLVEFISSADYLHKKGIINIFTKCQKLSICDITLFFRRHSLLPYDKSRLQIFFPCFSGFVELIWSSSKLCLLGINSVDFLWTRIRPLFKILNSPTPSCQIIHCRQVEFIVVEIWLSCHTRIWRWTKWMLSVHRDHVVQRSDLFWVPHKATLWFVWAHSFEF